MTEERKQELRRLLEEAMESLEIQSSLGQQSSFSADEYRKHLRECWTSYSEESRSVLDFRPEIVSDEAKSKLRGFIPYTPHLISANLGIFWYRSSD